MSANLLLLNFEQSLKAGANPVSDFFDAQQSIIEEIVAQTDASIEKAREYLLGLRDRINETLGDEDPDKWDQARMRAVLNSIDKQLADFQKEWGDDFEKHLNDAFDLGERFIDDPLTAAKIQSSVTAMSRELVQVIASQSFDYISKLTADIREAIGGTLKDAATGLINFDDAIDEINQQLGGAARARAETIARTEVGRIQAMAAHARMIQREADVDAAGYEYLKAWFTAEDDRVRESHEEAGAKYPSEEDEDGNGPIPINYEFEVGDETCLYPRDAALSAEEACNCRCISLPVIRKKAA